MRIAQVAPLYESVPPKLYGGTERVVSWLTEELVSLGHEVTLFATGDSMTTARLIAASPECIDQLAHHLILLEHVLRHKDEFDLIHFHLDYLHFPLSRRERYVHLTTLHGRLDIPDLVPLYAVYPEFPVVSISDAQREPLPQLNWQGTVHHGLPINSYKFHRKPGSYLAFLGRTSPEKGLDRAIEIAKAADMPLKIAAKIDKTDQEYFETVIQPALEDSTAEFIGEIGYPEKNDFLGNASALLFPISWPEPFGIVMIEAMACGTPVVAYPFGSVPEVVADGISGYLVSDQASAVEALKNIAKIDRKNVRRHFEQHFTVEHMTLDYLKIYERMVCRKKAPLTSSSGVLNWMKLPSPSSSTT
jgi:glycosyltransferase involved in cell wall biosynthesis